MKKLITVKLMILMMLGFSQSLVAQFQLQTTAAQSNNLNKPYYMYVFPSDSIAGFNDAAAQQDALNRKCFGNEFHIFLYAEKRRYINIKYSLTPVASNPSSSSTNPKGGPASQVNAAPCVNEGFESSLPTTLNTAAAAVGNTLTGWQVTSGMATQAPYNNCTATNNAPNPGCNYAWVRATPYTAPAATGLGVIGASPLGGTNVLQMNDNLAGGKCVRIQQTFPVTATNCLFQLAYRAALQNGHACCENPYIKVKVVNCFNAILPCPQVDVQPPGPSCASVTATGWQTNSSTWVTFTPNWIVKSLDLTPYLNSCVTIIIEVGDCPYGGHYGMAFIDTQCLPMNVTVNNISFSAAQPISFVASCGPSTATMTAPVGLGPYTWNGPASSTITNNPNQTVFTTVPGNYTLTMNPPGSCAPITKTINLQFGTFPTPGFNVSNNCTTYTITNIGSPAPSIQTYTILPSGPVSFSTTNNTSVVNLAPNTTYTIYQTVTNPANCPATASMVITTPNGPSPAFSTPTAICITSAATFSAVVSAGSHTYAFSSFTTNPGPIFTDPAGPVTFPASATYTITHTINTAGCIASTSSVIVVNAVPVATLNALAPVCVGASATLNAIGGPGQMTWTGPLAYSAPGPTAYVPGFQAVNAGIYTLTVNNFGCSKTFTVQVTAPVGPTVSVTNNGPICAGQPLVLTATWPASITPSWYYWYTYKPSPYFYSYGGYNVAQYTIATTTTLNAQSYVFWIQLSPSCPSVTFATTVSVITVTTPLASNTGPYCPGATIQLNSNIFSATSYTWKGPNTYSNSVVQNPTIPFASSVHNGNYTITVGAGACTKTAVTTVSVHPVPNAVAGSNNPVCAGTSINLTSNAAASYTWTGPNAFTSNAQNPVIPNSTTAMTGTYTLKITTAQGCTAVTTVTVGVLTPTTTAANTGPYCAGATISLSAPAATSYTWSGPNAFTSNAQNPTIPNAQPVASGNYTIIASIGTCTASATTSVTVNALPLPLPVNTGPYCANQTIQLNVNAYNSYTWTGPNTFNSNAQNPSVLTASVVNAGPYVVTVTDANGCVNSATTTVVVNPLPVVGVNTPTACVGGTLSLTASGGTAYAWVGPSAFVSALQNPDIFNAQVINSGNYSVTATSAFGCVNTSVLSASVIPLPVVSIAGTNTLCSQNFNGSPNQVTINGNGANSYNFTLPPGFIGSPSLTAPTFTLFPPVTAVQAVAQLSVVGTGPFGCTNTAVYDVTVVPNPTVVPAPATSSVCEGVSMNLTVGGAQTYTWSPSATLNTSTGPSVIASPSVTTIYSIIGSANGCNSATENATLIVVPNPTVVIVPGTPSICIGESITLTASGATTYSWDPGTNLNTTTGAVVIANPSVNMTYSVFGSQATCTHVTAVTVTVRPLPVITVGVSSPTMCMNNFNGSPNSVVFTAAGANTYTWGGFAGMTPNQTNGSSIVATSILQSALATGTVQGFDGYCYNTTSYSAVAIPNPIIAVTSNSMCFGATADISASGAITYTWSPNFNISSTTGSTITTFPPTTQVYNAFGNIAGCNSPTESGTITVQALPVIVVAPVNPTICAGQSIGLTAFGATNYTWTPAGSLSTANGNFVIASPGVTTNYTVIGEAATCTSSTIRQVGVTPLPIVTAASERTVICKGQKTTINANGSGTYTWNPHFGMIPSEFNSNFVTVSPTVSTTYTIYGQNGPCFNAVVFPIIVMEYPVLQLSTNVQKVCYGKSTSIFAMGAQSFSWAPNVDMQHLTFNMVTVTPSVSTNYTVMGINGSGSVSCMMTKEILIDVVPTITASATRSVGVCRGSSVKLSSGGSNQFVWAPATHLNNSLTAQPYASPNETTVYTVQVSDGGFCTETATCLVIVYDTPTVNAGEDFSMNIDDPMYLNAKGTGALKWVLGDGVLCHDCPNSQILPQNSGCYQIQATGENGCYAIDEVCIEITKDWSVYIPNVFTPNFDGLNDAFIVYGVGISDIEVTIFDRWGEQIYHDNQQTKGWDGTVRDSEGKQDVYQYLVSFKAIDGKKHTKTGHVTLLK
ncbi:MAG: gliding motility-associated C-terminal domain-containing protein [Bacteroidota bacterium]|nr:gliding motility-associated C-terminal domain-containing protein [Bacteroidota bacterium]